MSTDRLLVAAGILWFGTMAGFFWSFSAVVMPGLQLTDPTTALAAMQDINRSVRNPLFGIGFFGATLVAITLGIRFLTRGRAGVVPLLAAAIYLVGALGVTASGNVPLNETLAVVDRAAPGAASAMIDYINPWTNLNNMRALAALAATMLLIWALGHNRPATY